MNHYMQEKWSWIEGTHGMRTGLLETLSDADLAFNPGGENVSLGALCRELGEIEYDYLQSFKTFRQDWSQQRSRSGRQRGPPESLVSSHGRRSQSHRFGFFGRGF